MNWVTSESGKTLRIMYDPQRALFCSTSYPHDGEVVSSWDDPLAVRYTINTLLGLARAGMLAQPEWTELDPVAAFLAKYDASALNLGDRGLLVRALFEARHDKAAEHASALCEAAGATGAFAGLRLQEVCWLLVGLCAASANQVLGARDAANTVRRELLSKYWNKDSLMPLQLPGGARSRLVSFGGVVYFLWAMSEYAATFDDEYVRTIFRELAKRIIDAQGQQGDWAWHYDTRDARVIEWYEVYGVHQHSMSMLFLMPAIALDVPGAAEAVDRSLKWLLGDNQLGVPMYQLDPLLFFRSQRRELSVRRPGMQAGWPRTVERGYTFLLSSAAVVLGLRPAKPDAGHIEVNRECRSYELGWLVYIWGREERFEWFTSGRWATGAREASA